MSGFSASISVVNPPPSISWHTDLTDHSPSTPGRKPAVSKRLSAAMRGALSPRLSEVTPRLHRFSSLSAARCASGLVGWVWRSFRTGLPLPALTFLRWPVASSCHNASIEENAPREVRVALQCRQCDLPAPPDRSRHDRRRDWRGSNHLACRRLDAGVVALLPPPAASGNDPALFQRNLFRAPVIPECFLPPTAHRINPLVQAVLRATGSPPAGAALAIARRRSSTPP